MTNKLYNRGDLVDLYKKYQIMPDADLIIKLEDKITDFLGRRTIDNDTIVINGGYQANSIYLPLILESYSLILSDTDNHASIIKGLNSFKRINSRKLSSSTVKAFKSLYELEQILCAAYKNKHKHENIIVIVEGIYSMRGSILELDKLFNLLVIK